MNKRRLLKLAALLEADAKNKKGIQFDLRSWGRPSGRKSNFKSGQPSLDCSAAACAMGLACISGAFKRAGLTFDVSTPNAFSPVSHIVPRVGFERGMEAASALFDIPSHASAWLFYADRYPRNKRKGAEGERAVAKRIRDFAAGKISP